MQQISLYIYWSEYVINKVFTMNNKGEIKTLKGLQNTTPELFEPGITVSWNGTFFNVLNIEPDAEALKLKRIARALARQPRYVGHTPRPYSVAQHCVRGAQALILMGMVREAKQFLMHDAAEAITGDLSAPFKRHLGAPVKEVEEQLEKVIAQVYKIDFPFDDIIWTIDKNLAQDEMTMLLHSSYAEDFDFWDEERAYNNFLYTYSQIEECEVYEHKELVKK